MSDDRLEPLETAGMYVDNVVDLAGLRIRAGRRPHNAKECSHLNLTYSSRDRLIWCEDCSRNIDGFDAFLLLTSKFERMIYDVRRRKKLADDALRSTLVRRAAKELDSRYLGNMAPVCRSCRDAILPEDILNSGSVSIEIERARRRRAALDTAPAVPGDDA